MNKSAERRILYARSRRQLASLVGKSPTIVPGAVSGPAPQLVHPGDSRAVVPGGSQQSKYDVPLGQPPNTISDVGARNWYTPMQPVVPFGPPNVTWAREWDYPTGINLDYAPRRMLSYARWREMSKTWGVCATIIQTRIDQLLALPWEIQLKDKPRAQNKRVDELRDFFRRPDGKRKFNPWARMVLKDMFVLDAPTLHTGYRDLQGRPLLVEVLDGATIKVLVDDAGRLPDFPNPAYQQIIKGLPMVNFDETELIYAPMRPSPEYPIYGYSPIEQIEIELTEAIRKTFYTLGFWVEGNLPDLLMSVPKDWSANQIAAFQALFDSQLSGNLAEKSKVRFVPEGMKPYDVKNSSGEGLSSARDETLIRLACYAFSVSPTPFIRAVNRATAESAQQEAAQEGLHPLMSWMKDDVMDRIIQEEFGYDDTEFVWLPQAEVDQLKRSQVYMNLVKTALLTPNEAREDMGRQPVAGGDSLMIFTNNGVMTLADAIALGKAQAVMALVGPDGETPPGAAAAVVPSVPDDGTPSAGSAAPAPVVEHRTLED